MLPTWKMKERKTPKIVDAGNNSWNEREGNQHTSRMNQQEEKGQGK